MYAKIFNGKQSFVRKKVRKINCSGNILGAELLGEVFCNGIRVGLLPLQGDFYGEFNPRALP